VENQEEEKLNKFGSKLKSISDNMNSVSNMFTDVIWGILSPNLEKVFEQLDKGHVSKRIALYTSIGISVYSVVWAFDFAATTDKTGNEVAAIITAIMIPVNALTAAMFKFYTNFKKEG